MFFIMILLVTMFAFGVIKTSILYPQSPLSWNILNQVLYQPYFQMYGELFLEDGLFKTGIVLSCNSSLPCCRRRYFTWYFSLIGFECCKYQIACMYSPNQRCLNENFASCPLQITHHSTITHHYTSSDYIEHCWVWYLKKCDENFWLYYYRAY